MISYINCRNELKLEQSCEAPSVYLDHWALRLLSENLELLQRFISIIKSKNGSLALSFLNLMEFSSLESDQAHIFADRFIDHLLPNIFFMEINPFTIIKRENKLNAGAVTSLPHADTEFLEKFSKLQIDFRGGFSAAGLFASMHQSDPVKKEFALLADEFINNVEQMRNDTSLEDNIRRLPSGAPIKWGTRYVLKELIRTFLINTSIRLTRNNAIDLYHSVVPIAYFDFVLLDKHWEQQVSFIRNRFADANMNFPLAAVYSRKNDGIMRFFQALENYDG